MKKTIIFSLVGILFGSSVAYGAITIKPIKSHEYIGQIETFNKGNQFVYKVEDVGNTCYVLIGDDSKYGFEPQMSCVSSVVKK